MELINATHRLIINPRRRDLYEKVLALLPENPKPALARIVQDLIDRGHTGGNAYKANRVTLR